MLTFNFPFPNNHNWDKHCDSVILSIGNQHSVCAIFPELVALKVWSWFSLMAARLSFASSHENEMKRQTHWRIEPPGQMEHTMQTAVYDRAINISNKVNKIFIIITIWLVPVASLPTTMIGAAVAAAAAACNRLPAVICAFNDVFCVTVFRWLRSLCYTILWPAQPAQQNCRTFWTDSSMGEWETSQTTTAYIDELVSSVCCNQCIISYVVNFDLPALRKTAFHFPPCMHAWHAAIRGAESIRRLQIKYIL